nr:transposase, mutator type [Tanacetum cinerariifolium]
MPGQKAGKNNLFSIKLHHGGKFTPSPKRMYVGGKVNYVNKIDVGLFNVDELHMFIQDLGYDPKKLMFYHYKLPNKGLDYGLRPLNCDADLYLSPFKSTVEIEELDDDVFLNAPLVGSSKRLSLCWINKADVEESSVGKNDIVNVDRNVHEEHAVNVNYYTIDDMFELDIDENLNLDDYTVYVDENINENVNVDGNADENMNENVNADDEYVDEDMNENVNADDEYEQDNI